MRNLHREPLGGGMEIYVTDSYHFSTDTILLANFANRRGGRRRVDLGAGCGTIGLLWLKDNRDLEVTAVEIQAEACELLEQSVRLNDLAGNLTVLNADLKNLRGSLPFGAFDLVACNPPYKLSGTGVPNPGTKSFWRGTKPPAHWTISALRRQDYCSSAADFASVSAPNACPT